MFGKMMYCLLKINVLFEQINILSAISLWVSRAWNPIRTAPCITKGFVQFVCPNDSFSTLPKISFYRKEKVTSISRIAGGSNNNDLDSISAEVSMIPIVPVT